MENEVKEQCVNCEKESNEGVLWKMELDLSFYYYCHDCITKLFNEYTDFKEFLLLKINLS